MGGWEARLEEVLLSCSACFVSMVIDDMIVRVVFRDERIMMVVPFGESSTTRGKAPFCFLFTRCLVAREDDDVSAKDNKEGAKKEMILDACRRWERGK